MIHPKKISEKLLDYSKKHRIDHQLLLIRFFQERILYRLSISDFNENFLLKGGIFLYSIQENKARPTIDIDFLAHTISNDLDEIKQIFVQILSLSDEDGVMFDIYSLQATTINEQNQYVGVRLKVLASLGNIKQNIQIDIGFGDVVTPRPVFIHYPVLLDDFKVPIVNAYTIESAFAEKLQAIIFLAQLNSRMKDFYDLYTLINDHPMDKKLLKQAINETFSNRNATLNLDSIVFKNIFYNEPSRTKMWLAFLKKINVEPILFETVVQKIYNFVKTIDSE